MRKNFVKKYSHKVFKLVGSAAANVDVNADEVFAQVIDANGVNVKVIRQHERQIQKQVFPFLPSGLTSLIPSNDNLVVYGVVHIQKSYGIVDLSKRKRNGTNLVDEGFGGSAPISYNMADSYLGIKETINFQIQSPPTGTYEAYVIITEVNYVPA